MLSSALNRAGTSVTQNMLASDAKLDTVSHCSVLCPPHHINSDRLQDDEYLAKLTQRLAAVATQFQKFHGRNQTTGLTPEQIGEWIRQLG